MNLKLKILNALSLILNGSPKITHAKISYLAPNDRLKGKKIIITGGAGGLGFAMAKKFIQEGASVLIAGRNIEKLEKCANEIDCKYLQLDVTNIDKFHDFINNASQMLGGINILVNNAGVSLHENSFMDVTEKQYDQQFDINLKGAFFLTQTFIQYCLNQNVEGFKKIIFVSSETSKTVDERPYGLTKVAMNSLVQGIACKYVKNGFRINAIAPGITASDMTGYKADGNLTLQSNPTERIFLPEEIAEIASFLCCDASNIINGEIICCNEGNTINTRW